MAIWELVRDAIQTAHDRGQQWLTAREVIHEVLTLDPALNTGTIRMEMKAYCINDPSKRNWPGLYRRNPLFVTDAPSASGKHYRLLTEQERHAFLSKVRDDLETMGYPQLVEWLASPATGLQAEPLPQRAVSSQRTAVPKRRRTSDRMESRVKDLIANFDLYVQAFNEGNPFTGPSVYFHHKTLAVLRQYPTACSALQSDEFFDCLYATLASWGMHRMGPAGAKLEDIAHIKDSFRRQEPSIRALQSLSIGSTTSAEVSDITARVWDVLDGLQVSKSGTKLVANSKALHHLLPALVPPIDRAYTLRFFYNNMMLSKGDQATFKEIYPYFHRIAVACREQITSHLGAGLNTSETKVIDNAIIGLVRTQLGRRA